MQKPSAKQITAHSQNFSLWLIVILLAILKTTGVLAISWWWVFCPIWIPMLVVLAFVFIPLGFAAGLLGIAFLIDKYNEHKMKKTRRKF